MKFLSLTDTACGTYSHDYKDYKRQLKYIKQGSCEGNTHTHTLEAGPFLLEVPVSIQLVSLKDREHEKCQHLLRLFEHLSLWNAMTHNGVPANWSPSNLGNLAITEAERCQVNYGSQKVLCRPECQADLSFSLMSDPDLANIFFLL